MIYLNSNFCMYMYKIPDPADAPENRQMLGVRENLGVSVRSLSDQGSVMVEPAVRYPTVRSVRY